MGLLDEAIREHLDLKRRRGADPAEIERDEQEALGPARRDPDELGADELEDGPGEYDAEFAELEFRAGGEYEPEAEELELESAPEFEPRGGPADFDPHADAEYEPPAEATYDAPTELAYQDAGEGVAPFDHETELSDPLEEAPESPMPPPHPASSAPPPTRDDPASSLDRPASDEVWQETEEYDVEAEGGSEDAEKGQRPRGEEEAMLEETPDFLQDTPEHDRLWFEQRPPRDFDFDG